MYIYDNAGYYIPMGVFAAMLLTVSCGTARFQNVKHKASSTPFLYIGPRPSTPPFGGLRSENGAKLRKKSEPPSDSEIIFFIHYFQLSFPTQFQFSRSTNSISLSTNSFGKLMLFKCALCIQDSYEVSKCSFITASLCSRPQSPLLSRSAIPFSTSLK